MIYLANKIKKLKIYVFTGFIKKVVLSETKHRSLRPHPGKER
jgi:hypothetical protein